MADFQENCTPGYYNNEGKINNIPQNNRYGGGAVAFYELLKDWRKEGSFEGLKLSQFLYTLELLKKPLSSSDLESIWTINQANIPEVGNIDCIKRLKRLIDWSCHLIVVRNEEIVGFIILMRENQSYESLNYEFFNSQ